MIYIETNSIQKTKNRRQDAICINKQEKLTRAETPFIMIGSNTTKHEKQKRKYKVCGAKTDFHKSERTEMTPFATTPKCKNPINLFETFVIDFGPRAPWDPGGGPPAGGP